MNPILKIVLIVVAAVAIFYALAIGYIWLMYALNERDNRKVIVEARAEPKCNADGNMEHPVYITIRNSSNKITDYVDTHFNICFAGDPNMVATMTDREETPIKPGETRTKCYALNPKEFETQYGKMTSWSVTSTAHYLPAYLQEK